MTTMTKRDVARGAAKRFQSENMTDIAAALTYYAVLSIFPALIALISVVGLIGNGAADPIKESLAGAPGPVSEILTDVVDASVRTGGGWTFTIGVLVALWSATGYVGAFSRASNGIFGVTEDRPFWRLRPAQFGVTAFTLALVGVASTASVLSGPLAREFGDMVGVGEETTKIWDLAKLPGVLLIGALVVTILMYATPNVRFPSWRSVLPGGAIAMVAFVAGSFVLGLYFTYFADYGKSYGALGGVVAFLVWLWVMNNALLFGQLINAERQPPAPH